MKIGLSFINQIRNLLIPSADLVEQQDTTALERARQNGGGWIAQQLNEGFAQVAAGYHAQHNDDDTHKTITATGSITERGRTAALGEWIPVPFSAANFVGGIPTMTWTVDGSDIIINKYTLIGKTCVYAFNIFATSIGGVANNFVSIVLPPALVATSVYANACTVIDNGTFAAGLVQIGPGTASVNTVLNLLRADVANFAAAANTTGFRGIAIFEVS